MMAEQAVSGKREALMVLRLGGKRPGDPNVRQARSCTGSIFAANSARVGRRPDLGEARIDRPDLGASVAVLHNAIGPGPSVAALAAEAAMAVMAPDLPDATVLLTVGTPVVKGETARVDVDSDGRVLRVVTTDPGLLQGQAIGAAVYLGAEVRQSERLLGHVTEEAFCIVEDGRLASMSGQSEFNIPYRSAPRRG